MRINALICILSMFCYSQLSHAAESKITLQDHQLKTVNYLLAHKEQKGLLLYHSLGSGKTYVAIAYAEKFPEKKVVVFLPRFLKSNWHIQIKSYGVQQPSRYEMYSFEEIDELLKKDLSNTILVIDEIHKFNLMVHHRDPIVASKFSELYFQMRKAQKIIALTGTPIFNDASDIAFIGNLIAGKDLFPYDRNKFRNEYKKIKPITSLFRGYFTESKLMASAFPFVVTMTGVVLFTAGAPLAIPLISIAGSIAIPLANELIPASQVSFREFDPEKLKEFTSQYISFYEIPMIASEDYPEKFIHAERVHYSNPQSHFFFNLADEDLSREELRMLLDEDGKQYTDEYINFHSMDIQKSFLHDPVLGREIGNFSLKDEKGVLVEAPKFMRILQLMKASNGKIALYSNYYKNGIVKFAEFLDRNGFSKDYVVLSPDLSVEKQIQNIEDYNAGKKRIILIHPEITEGVSLVGTEQLHVLEPIPNHSLLEQVIGRAVRYQSHAHLPKEHRKVDVYLWESYVHFSSYYPTPAGKIRRKHWQKRYSEINPSMWSKGIVEVDTNYFRKEQTTDSIIVNNQDTLVKDIENFKELLRRSSIETPKASESVPKA